MSEQCMSTSERAKLQRQRLRETYQRHVADTGSTEVQGAMRPWLIYALRPAADPPRACRLCAVAQLTARVAAITRHLESHRKDVSTRRGLMQLLEQRRKLLKRVTPGT